jgi:type IX secretion system PorP/SprF family membrane protein
MKYKIITTITGLILAFQLSAQQEANFSQYFFDPLTVNPAYAGSRGTFSGTLCYRNQWLGGITGAPVTQALDAHMPLGDNIGVGLQLYNDQAGPLRVTSATAIFVYSIHVAKDTKLAFGLAGSLNNVGINFSEINVDMPNDPAFPTNNMSSMIPDANFGMYLYKQNFYVGLSATHLIQSDWKLQNTAVTAVPTAMFYRQYYFTAGYVAKLSDNFALRPSMLVQYVQAAPALEELDGTIIYKERYFIGLGIRNSITSGIGSNNDLVISLEYDLGNKFSIGYSYDLFLNPAGSYSTGTHEIMLGWDLASGAKTRMVNPRYF